MPLTIGRFFFFFFFQIPILLNTQSQSQGMLEGLLASSIIVSSGLQIILNFPGDSDYPLISVFRITHVSSYGQAIELKVYLQEKKKSFCLPFQERNRDAILERTIKEIDFAFIERKTRMQKHVMCINIAQVPGLRGASQVVLVVKNLPASAGGARDACLIPRLGRFPEGGHGNPFQ